MSCSGAASATPRESRSQGTAMVRCKWAGPEGLCTGLGCRFERKQHLMLPLPNECAQRSCLWSGPCLAGAFMTANLLAHAGHLFACGIARSGVCCCCCGWQPCSPWGAITPLTTSCCKGLRMPLCPSCHGCCSAARLPQFVHPPNRSTSCRCIQPHTHALWLPGGGAHVLAGATAV